MFANKGEVRSVYLRTIYFHQNNIMDGVKYRFQIKEDRDFWFMEDVLVLQDWSQSNNVIGTTLTVLKTCFDTHK